MLEISQVNLTLCVTSIGEQIGMRIKKILAKDILPVKLFEVDNLSDLVVIAGPNGVGKTRLISGILQYMQNFNGTNPSFNPVVC